MAFHKAENLSCLCTKVSNPSWIPWLCKTATSPHGLKIHSSFMQALLRLAPIQPLHYYVKPSIARCLGQRNVHHGSLLHVFYCLAVSLSMGPSPHALHDSSVDVTMVPVASMTFYLCISMLHLTVADLKGRISAFLVSFHNFRGSSQAPTRSLTIPF